ASSLLGKPSYLRREVLRLLPSPGSAASPTRAGPSNEPRGKCIPRLDPVPEHRTPTGRRSLWRTTQEALRRRPPFFAGPFARRSASSSTARSSVTVSGSSPLRRLALVSPSVT